MKALDLTNLKFGRLTALRLGPHDRNGMRQWVCRCACGTEKLVRAGALTQGKQRSCGCLRDEKIGAVNRTHGQAQTAEYSSWSKAKSRCYNPKNPKYPHYGRRGISMCDAWLNDFPAFLSDMGPRPSKRHSLDRINVNGNYEPSNCRWATAHQQASNKQHNHLIIWQGRTQTLSEWADETGIGRACVLWRIEQGWPLHQVFRLDKWTHQDHGSRSVIK